MRCIVLGNKNMAIGCSDALLGQEHEIIGIVLNPGDEGVDQHGYLSLKKWAQGKNLSVIQPTTVNQKEMVEWVYSKYPDALFSFSYLRILKSEILSIPRIGSFNIHFGYLPQHRGNLPLVYAMASNESFAGVTLHIMDEGIDTGDVVAQTKVPILKTDTAKDMYFKCVDAGIELFENALPKIAKEQFERVPQKVLEKERGNSYHPMKYPNDRWIDWSQHEDQIDAFIRAHSFPPYPGARFKVGDQVVEIRSDGSCYHIEGKIFPTIRAVADVFR
jgi:methionyl-tRNA formyltransferase